MTKAPLWFSVPPITLSPAILPTGMDFPSEHGLIDRTSPLDDLAVHRDLLARPHAQGVADLHLLEGNLFVGAFRMNDSRGLWRKIEQRADRAARLLARSELKDLPK